MYVIAVSIYFSALGLSVYCNYPCYCTQTTVLHLDFVGLLHNSARSFLALVVYIV